MKLLLAATLFAIGISGSALAIPSSPEIDPASGVSALALLSGALVLVRGRRKQ
jgi:hypothetical protein